MKALIFWARDQKGTLRLARRTPTEVSGTFVRGAEELPFCFELQARRLTLTRGDDITVLQLNEYGWVE